MATSIGTSGVTFPDATVQSTAFTGSGGGGFNGATVTSSAADITLTSSSTQTQTVSMTAAGKFVILPNATTLSSKGGPIFIIQNKGQNPFGIKDASGNVIAPLLWYGQSTALVLLSNASSAGSWGTVAQSSAGVFGTGLVNVSTALVGTSQSVKVAGLSSTQALIAYSNNASNNIQVLLATISGSTVTFGSPVTLASTTQPLVLAATAMTSSLAVFMFATSSGTPSMVAVSVSGSTVTPGAAVAVSGVGLANSNSTSVFAESATAGACAFTTDDGTTILLTARGFTVSGTTISFGSAQNLYSASSGYAVYLSTAKLASGSYVSIYNFANTTGYARPWTSSAGTVTLGTQSAAITTPAYQLAFYYASQPPYGYGASSTCGVFSYAGYAVVANVSGTTISSTSAQYYSQYTAPLGQAQPFGTGAALVADQYGNCVPYTGSANGFGGAAPAISAGMLYSNNAYLDATTNIMAGVYNTGYLCAVIVKGN